MASFVDNLTSRVDDFMQLVHNKPIDWEGKPAPGRWSNKEIIGHLCDSAMVNLQRFVRCTYQENFKLVYEQNEWVAVQRYQEMEVKTLLELWLLLNLQISRILGNYPADRWQTQCDTGRMSESLHTVEYLANDYVVHLQHHLDQIRFKE